MKRYSNIVEIYINRNYSLVMIIKNGAEKGAKNVFEAAAEMLTERLEKYNNPPIDEGLEQASNEIIAKRKKLILS